MSQPHQRLSRAGSNQPRFSVFADPAQLVIMRTLTPLFLLMWSCAAIAADAPSPTAPTAIPAPPPAAPAKRSAADLEKLVAPIALYPDPLIATILPASVYPLEIVQAARFVADTNNLAQLDRQSWDENVKAVARVPEVIQEDERRPALDDGTGRSVPGSGQGYHGRHSGPARQRPSRSARSRQRPSRSSSSPTWWSRPGSSSKSWS